MRKCVSCIGIVAMAAAMITLHAHSGLAQDKPDPIIEPLRSTIGTHLDDGYQLIHFQVVPRVIFFILQKKQHHMMCRLRFDQNTVECHSLNRRSYN